MKVAYIVDSIIPSQNANSVHAMKMAQAFSQLCDVSLICKFNGGSQIEECYSRYGIENNFRIVRMYTNEGHSAFRKLSILSYGIKVSRVIKKEYYDYLYGRSLIGLYFSKNKAPFIYEAHDWPANHVMSYLLKKLVLNKNCKGVVTISNELKKEFVRKIPVLKEEKIYVLHDGADEIDRSVEKAKLDNSESKSKVVVGYLGHLYPGKCMEILLEIADRMPEIVFHVVGGTEEMLLYWNKLIADANINNVKMYGFVQPADVGKWYSAFDIFLLPLQAKVLVGNGTRDIGKWISPLKLFEAMSYGKAIVSSSLPTIKEVLCDGVDGFLADPNDIDEWVEKIGRLIENEELREKMGKNAKDKLEREYSWTKRAEKIIDFLNDGGQV